MFSPRLAILLVEVDLRPRQGRVEGVLAGRVVAIYRRADEASDSVAAICSDKKINQAGVDFFLMPFTDQLCVYLLVG